MSKKRKHINNDPRRMTEEEENQVVDALTAWFQSQKISAFNAVPIMAKAISVACATLTEHDGGDWAHFLGGIEIAADMVRDAPEKLVRRAGEIGAT
jgi:hypothetical protein